MTLTIGSLFSGIIGGLELGLERAGLGPVLFQIESDPFCRRVLERHWPDAVRYDDVRTATASLLPAVDILCGGSPCQGFSSAGKGKGFDDERSGLWREFARLAGELGPRVVVVENVASGARRWLPFVRRDLHVLGYGTRAYALSAADVGAPHLRRRIFVVAHADRERQLPQGNAVSEVRRRPRDRAPAPRPWAPHVAVRHMADGIPRRLDWERALGNACVPACSEVIGRIVRERLDEGPRSVPA